MKPAVSSAGGSPRPFEPLDLSVLDAGDGRLWLSAHSRQGEVHGVPRLRPVFPDALSGALPSDWFGGSIRRAERQHQPALALGRVLGDLVFGVPEIATLLDQTRAVAADRGAQLLLRLLVAPSELAAWPWELMTDPRQPSSFLALARDAHLVRTPRARTFPTRHVPTKPPLHVLLVLSSPLRGAPGEDEAVFDLYEEKRALLTELRPLVERGLLVVDVEDRPSVERLRSRMARQRRGYHVVHYLGHAQPDGLRLEDRNGRGRLVLSSDVAALLQELPELHLAVFAGCETARAPATRSATLWPGQLSLADFCVRDASPSVVGMQAVLPFATERLFTRFFYQALTAGRSVAEALRQSRLAIAADDQVGGDLLDWAVPCLFVGGGDPGPLLDPMATSTPAARQRRASLRLDAKQTDRRFFARQAELREAIDVLAGHNRCRLLQVVGGQGVGKSSLLDRAVEELDDGVTGLYVQARRLLDCADPVHELCCLVAEVMQRGGCRTAPRGQRTPVQWWERLVDEVVEEPLAIVIDDADNLLHDTAAPLVQALSVLLHRRGQVRVAIGAARENPGLASGLHDAMQRVVRLQPLSWPEVWQWVRRNLPVLTRYSDSQLAPFFTDLGPHLELWADLADAVSQRAALDPGDLPQLVDAVANRLSTLTAGRMQPPPVFSAAPPNTDTSDGAALAEAAKTAPVTPFGQPLRVAVAGPHTEGRGAEFARAVTGLAASVGVGGRVVPSGAPDGSSSLAQLLALPSPFSDGATATTAALLKWWSQASGDMQAADVMLLDFGGSAPSRVWDDLIARTLATGTLLVAAGGNAAAPVYPGWCQGVLAVGALQPRGDPLAPALAPYAWYDAQLGKPELFAPGTLDGSPLQGLVASGQQGSSFAAMHVLCAALMVWASDRSLAAAEVRSILIDTARPFNQGLRALDLQAALDSVRRQRLLDALEWGPLDAGELLAETGLRSEQVIRLLDAMVEAGNLRVVLNHGKERFEHVAAIYLIYDQIRRTAAASAERTQAMTQLVHRVRQLALRGRFEPADMRTLWDSGHDGRRVVALAAMVASPALGNLDLALAGIRDSRSAFEQYQALALAMRLLPTLTAAQRKALAEELRRQRHPPGWIIDGCDRAPMADEMLQLLAAG